MSMKISKLMRIVEFAWLFLVALGIFELISSAYKGVYTNALLYGSLAVVAMFMFFFRRKQRLKQEAREQSNIKN